MTRRISAHGRKLLTKWEGSSPAAYEDSAGFLTIGVGHKLTHSELTSGKINVGGVHLQWRHGLTGEEVDALLTQDLLRFELAVSSGVPYNLPQHKFDALVSFAFNVGREAFINSTLRRMVVKEDEAEVLHNFRRWVWAKGKIHPGLIARREKEIKLWRGEV